MQRHWANCVSNRTWGMCEDSCTGGFITQLKVAMKARVEHREGCNFQNKSQNTRLANVYSSHKAICTLRPRRDLEVVDLN